jgi:hypothetical protein
MTSTELFPNFRKVRDEREDHAGAFIPPGYGLRATIRAWLAGALRKTVSLHRVLDGTRRDAGDSSGVRLHRSHPNRGATAGREQLMNELTREQANNLRLTAEYLTLQMRLTPHPTERSRIRAMADTADFVAERIDAFLTAKPAEPIPQRTPIGELLRRLPLGYSK